jgi:hypothetical protein
MTERAVVMREHRTAVIVAENGNGLASPIQFDWIQNGGDSVLDRYAQAIADAEARGRAEVLRSQANEYGRHPGPIAPTPRADREGLEADVALVRDVMSRPGEWSAATYRASLSALSRIAAALGLKEGA